MPGRPQLAASSFQAAWVLAGFPFLKCINNLAARPAISCRWQLSLSAARTETSLCKAGPTTMPPIPMQRPDGVEFIRDPFDAQMKWQKPP
jgi:hypothetical protein